VVLIRCIRCDKEIEKITSRRYCESCRQDVQRENMRKNHGLWRKRHPEKVAAGLKRYREEHRVELNTYGKKYRKEHPEEASVRTHHRSFFNRTSANYKYYQGMPFAEEWNPDKGGSLRAGADWIIRNLGRRPKGSSLHIVEHEKGFVPGNLEWTAPTKQANQQMFKIIAQLRHRIKELEDELSLYKQQRYSVEKTLLLCGK
jgi:hypothetical protein